MRWPVISLVAAALAACAPTTHRPAYSEVDIAREADIQRQISRGEQPRAPSPPTGVAGAADSLGPASLSGMGSPPATTSLSNSARLDVIATRISIAAAPFCDTHVKMDLVDGQEVKRCSYPWRLAAAKGVNAKADGKSIAINADLLDFVASDDEVALVFGHELAHNTMHHLDKQRGNAILGTVAGVLVSAALGVNVGGAFSQIGRGMYSQSFEAEADYVGAYYAALAGYDYHGAAAFMRRMGAEHPQAISHGSSHPPTAERYVALEKAAREIDGKIARGEPLIPNGVELAGRDRAQSSSMAQSSSEPISATPPPGEDSYSRGVPGR